MSTDQLCWHATSSNPSYSQLYALSTIRFSAMPRLHPSTCLERGEFARISAPISSLNAICAWYLVHFEQWRTLQSLRILAPRWRKSASPVASRNGRTTRRAASASRKTRLAKSTAILGSWTGSGNAFPCLPSISACSYMFIVCAFVILLLIGRCIDKCVSHTLITVQLCLLAPPDVFVTSCVR
mgnify:CR=1 FL=1